MFVIYSCHISVSCAIIYPSRVKWHFSPLKVFTDNNFEAGTLRFFLHLEAYLFLRKTLFIFSILSFVLRPWTFSHKMSFFFSQMN